jgi:hypothetical protein
VIYLDSAAVVKLVRQEADSTELVSWLNAHDELQLVSSTDEQRRTRSRSASQHPHVTGSAVALDDGQALVLD